MNTFLVELCSGLCLNVALHRTQMYLEKDMCFRRNDSRENFRHSIAKKFAFDCDLKTFLDYRKTNGSVGS